MSVEAAKKTSAKKKKKVSKHVLEARAKQQTTPSTDEPPKKRRQKKNRHVKSASEAVQYLTLWQSRDSGSGWKFNKNTQHWLFRHMYQADILPKSAFGIMLEYIRGYPSKEGQKRLQMDATKLALRYEAGEKNKGTSENDSKTPEPSDQDDEEARWEKLNDHEKRKQYKRARKILELLKEMAEADTEK